MNSFTLKSLKEIYNIFLDLKNMGKIGLSICLLMAVIVLFVGLTFYYHYKYEFVTAEADKTQSQLKEELFKIITERNSAQTQLAPFLAVANKQFADIPKDQRLDKVLQILEAIQRSVAKRIMSQEVRDAVVKVLRTLPKKEVTIMASMDGEAQQLSLQFENIFKFWMDGRKQWCCYWNSSKRYNSSH